MVWAVRAIRACPNGMFAFAAMDDGASTEHVVDCGVGSMFGVSVLAGGAGVVGIGAKSMRPAVVEAEMVAGLVDRFVCVVGIVAVGGIVAVAGLGAGEGSKALIVGVGHVCGKVGPRFFCCRSCSPFLEGIGEDAAVF